jgi:hypothetical protein
LIWRWSDGSFFDQKRMWGQGEPSSNSKGFCTLFGYESVGMRGMHELNDEHCTLRRKYACKWCPRKPLPIEPSVPATRGTVCTETPLSGDAPAEVWLACNSGVISEVLFASVGRPYGKCTTKSQSEITANPYCHASAKAIVEASCLGQSSCGPQVSQSILGDRCPGQDLRFMARVQCSDIYESTDTNSLPPVPLPLPPPPPPPRGPKAKKPLPPKLCRIGLNTIQADESIGESSVVGGPGCTCPPGCAICRDHKHKSLQGCFLCTAPDWAYEDNSCVKECSKPGTAQIGSNDQGLFCGTSGPHERADPPFGLCIVNRTAIGNQPCQCTAPCEVCTWATKTATPGKFCFRCTPEFSFLGTHESTCRNDTTQLGVKENSERLSSVGLLSFPSKI